MKHLMVYYLASMLLAFFILSGCKDYVAIYKNKYNHNKEAYYAFLHQLDSIQGNDENVKVAIVKHQSLSGLQLILTDTSSIYSQSYYFYPKAERNSDIPAKYINSCQIFGTLNCRAIEYINGNLFIALGPNRKSNNSDVESGLLLVGNNKVTNVGTSLQRINDSVYIFEKRIF
jgi:hypothetical protein